MGRDLVFICTKDIDYVRCVFAPAQIFCFFLAVHILNAHSVSSLYGTHERKESKKLMKYSSTGKHGMGSAVRDLSCQAAGDSKTALMVELSPMAAWSKSLCKKFFFFHGQDVCHIYLICLRAEQKLGVEPPMGRLCNLVSSRHTKRPVWPYVSSDSLAYPPTTSFTVADYCDTE